MLELKDVILKLQRNKSEFNYQKNMQLLKQKDLKLYKKISALPKQEDYGLYRENTNDIYNLVSLTRQTTYYALDNIVEDVKSQLTKLELKNAQIAIFTGMGLGYEVIEFVNNIMPSQGTRYILIVEKDPQIFKKALEATLLTDLIERVGNGAVKFIVGEEDNSQLFVILQDFIKEDNKFFYSKCLGFIYYGGALNWFKSYYLNVIRTYNKASTYIIEFYGNCPDDSLIGLVNMLDNIEDIINNPGVKLLYDKFKGKPAIIASTGPSFNRSKYLLKGIEDKALIIAPDASLKILKEIGVSPHIITTLERVDETVNFFTGYEYEDVKDIYLSAAPVVMKGVYENYPGPRIITFRNFNHFRWIGVDKGILEIGKSSGNMAFNIAVALGCDPIILVGQDLALGDDGASHAEGAIYKSNKDLERPDLIKVKGNYTDYVLTEAFLYDYLRDYEVDMAKYKGLCINSTDGGAYISGTKLMPFAEAIEKYITKPIYPLDIIKKNLSNFDESQIEKDRKYVLSIVEKAIDEFEEMVDITIKGIEIWKTEKDKLEMLLKEKNYSENYDYIVKLLKELTDFYNKFKSYDAYEEVFLHIIQSFEIQFIIDGNKLLGEASNKDEANVTWVLRLGEWMVVNGRIAELTQNELKKAKQNILKIKS